MTTGSHAKKLSAAFKKCVVNSIEDTFSPAQYKKDSADDKEALRAKAVVEVCAQKFPPTGEE